MTFSETITGLRSISEELKNKGITVEKLDEAISELTKHHNNIREIEDNIDAIKDEVIAPIKEELIQNKTAGRFSVFGFWVGAIGLVVSIGTLLSQSKGIDAPFANNHEISERLHQIETQLLFPKGMSTDPGEIVVKRSERMEIASLNEDKFYIKVDSTAVWPRGEGIKGGINIYKNGILLGNLALKNSVTRSDGVSELRPWFDAEALAVDVGDKIEIGTIQIEVKRILNVEPKGRFLGDAYDGIVFHLSENQNITSQSTRSQ
ncbi:hypothetical protein A9264_15870 [Vibrio sp. UCD-FRSSP16_10]|uniref:hypothetical protein n=1 Tax=unclassified Vibrio TaxID=2614977 RepID=UPI0008025072|nr:MULTISPECIES: hypothetical protein [unclassified Vibrio]OBT12748.1 hypothetical protein A9260_15880 [Vibrio sp. UCD-FRSSP16_30]OBT18201.1 hypothetical protein A9264_15870 [Vibrio sp. UCD-FRSSP16_10]